MATTKKNPAEEAETLDYRSLNVFQKLQTARVLFLNSGVKKTGKNMHLEFTYFELVDIVPTAEAIFAKVGLTAVPRFTADTAFMKVYDVDNPDEFGGIEFSAPFTQIAPIVSNTGKVVTNEMQALGSSITYMRRYLWQLVLDIIETDGIDSILGASDDDAPAPQKTTKKPPVTAEKRKEIKSELTAPEAQADELQITALKAALKELLEADPEQESFVQEIAIKTEGFTKITKAACEQLINGVSEMIAAYTPEE
jgi:hypothetical protein